MKQKIDIEETCKIYNLAREKNKGRKGPSKWIVDILMKEGLSKSLSLRMLNSSTLFQKYNETGKGKGRHIGYIWPQSSVYISWFQNWLYPPKKNNTPIKKEQFSEEECKEYLERKGYLVQKLEFDENAFKKEYPQLWEKFLIPVK